MKFTFKFSSFLAFLIALGIFTACSDDSTSSDDPAFDQLIGTWNATEFTFTNNANSSQSIDFLNTFNASISMEIKSDKTYTIRITSFGQTTTQSGNIDTDSDGNIELDDDANIQTTLSGNTLTIVDNSESYDFDNNGSDEAATMRQVWQKQ